MEKKTKVRIYSLNLLKVLAVLLIFNSHCHALYPIPALATGGALGNSVFFIVSGYFTKAETDKVFWKSFWGKLKRIYLITWIGVLMEIVIQHEPIFSLSNGVSRLIWPTAYWFGGALLVFNLLLYAIEKLKFREHFVGYSLIMLLAYAVAYLMIVDRTTWSVETPGLDSIAGYFKCIQYFYIYSLGYVVRGNGALQSDTKKGMLCIGAAVVSFILQGIMKLAMVRLPVLYQVQFISQICNATFSLSLLVGFIMLEETYCAHLGEKLRAAVDWLSGLSYEMYAVQFIVIAHCVGLAFPVNVLAALLLTTAAAYAVNRVVQLVIQIIG